LEEGTTNSPRATILEFEGGSFTVLGTEDFVVPDNCVATQQVPDEPTQPTTAEPTQAPVDITPSPTQPTIAEPTQAPVDITPSPSTVEAPPSLSVAETLSPSTAVPSQRLPTSAPADTTPAPTAPESTLAPTLAPKSSSSAPTIQGSLPSPHPSKPHYGFLSPKQKHHWKESKKMKHVNIFQMDNEGKGSYFKGHYSMSTKGKKSTKVHKGNNDHYHGHHKNVALNHKKSWKKHGTYTTDN
jgi:hypothetical protein